MKRDYPVFYYFDINSRVYEKNGVRSNSLFYEEQFVKINIIDETDKEYICDYGRVINKRSMLYKLDNSTRKKVYTEKEKDDDIYVKTKSYQLSDLMRRLDADTLREVESLLIRIKKLN